MILQKHHVMLLQIGLDRLRHFVCRGRAVRCHRHRANGNYRLDHGVLVQCLVGNGITGCHRRVCMQHGPHIGTFPIAAEVHFDFRGRPQPCSPLQHFALVVDANQLVRCDEAFAHAGRCCKKGAVLQLHGNISVIGSHPAQLPHLVADITKLFFDFLFVH